MQCETEGEGEREERQRRREREGVCMCLCVCVSECISERKIRNFFDRCSAQAKPGLDESSNLRS